MSDHIRTIIIKRSNRLTMVRAHVKFVGLGNCDPVRFPGICTPALPRRDSIEQLRKVSLAANVRGWLVTLRVCTKLGCSDAIFHDWWICANDQFGKNISLSGKSRRDYPLISLVIGISSTLYFGYRLNSLPKLGNRFCICNFSQARKLYLPLI